MGLVKETCKVHIRATYNMFKVVIGNEPRIFYAAIV